MRKVYACTMTGILVFSLVSFAVAPDHTQIVTGGLDKFVAWKAQGMEHGKALGLLKQFYLDAGMEVYLDNSDMIVIGYGDKSALLLGEPDTLGSGRDDTTLSAVPLGASPPNTWPTDNSAVLLDPFQWQGGVFSNPALFSAITSDLQDAGYSVSYYKNTQVTISLIETKLDSGVVFNRGHGGYDSSTGQVMICSGERWSSTRYVYEQSQGWVVRAYILHLGVYYDFFTYMPGLISNYYSNLPNSLIYMESCEGLRNTTMANAWTGRGAGAYMSWTKSVLVVDGDEAAEENFHDMCINGLSVSEVVAKGYKSVGARLSYSGTGTLGL
ncbi:MAG: hypothetical protein HXS44_15425 [Theionarchaea archaeon]|nr:hypothetical protein [Theionarchaea archaeon]